MRMAMLMMVMSLLIGAVNHPIIIIITVFMIIREINTTPVNTYKQSS